MRQEERRARIRELLNSAVPATEDIYERAPTTVVVNVSIGHPFKKRGLCM